MRRRNLAGVRHCNGGALERAERQEQEVKSMGDTEEVICPACTECSMFTIINIGVGSWAKCCSCGHLIELELIGRHATAGLCGAAGGAGCGGGAVRGAHRDTGRMTPHRNDVLHWAPEAVEEKPFTACGRNIDGPCDRHSAEGCPCQHGVAWTRSTDLEAYQGRPMEKWPPPCPVCTAARPADS